MCLIFNALAGTFYHIGDESKDEELDAEENTDLILADFFCFLLLRNIRNYLFCGNSMDGFWKKIV